MRSAKRRYRFHQIKANYKTAGFKGSETEREPCHGMSHPKCIPYRVYNLIISFHESAFKMHSRVSVEVPARTRSIFKMQKGKQIGGGIRSIRK